IMALIVFAITQGCILSQFFAKGEPNSDYIVVLGAQMRDWGPSIIFKHRLDAAAEYLEANPETTVIVTGGKGANETISEGEGGKEYLMEHGIAEERILIETTSVNTSANIINAFALLPDEEEKALHIGIVTNNFHVFRGTMLAKKYTEANISGVAAKTNWLYLPNNMVRESFGILKDFLK
ncbi:MAG: YdcF family protein, partial [Lachnospiraceae bacterium]|nr:YdcF family protein [Lachnospiraceae bacterium]